MANKEHELEEEEEFIKRQAEIESRLDELMKEKMGALSKIRDLVRGRVELEQDLDKISEREKGLQGNMMSLKHRIGDISREMDETGEEEKILEVHKKKTELIQERAKVEEGMDNVTQEKVGLLDRIKEMTKSRSELECVVDGIETEEVGLKKEIANLKETTRKFIFGIRREIGDMDREEKIDVDSGENADKIRGIEEEMLERATDQVSGEKPEMVKKGFLGGVFGKQKIKEEPKQDMEVSMDDLLGMGLLKDALGIIDDLLEKLPERVVDDFSKSEEFNRYEAFYNVVKSYNGEPDQRRYIDENVKDILSTINTLLKKLPKEVISEFSRSKDFDIYNGVLSKYGIRSIHN